MKPQCVNAINKAAGRALTPAQLKAIEDRLSAKMRQMARDDPAWRSKSNEQRTTEAATAARDDIANEASRKVQNAQRQVIATLATRSRINDLRASYGRGDSHALAEELQLAGNAAEGLKRDSFSGLLDTIDAAKNTDGTSLGRKTWMFLFDSDNPIMTRDLVREVFALGNGLTKNTVAQKGAKAWLDTIETLRQRFNSAGGDVGKLDYGYMPQPHDVLKVGKAGVDKWSAETLPLLDRSRYLHEDGRMMNDAEVLNILRESYVTISTDGISKITPGETTGSGSRANRHGDGRVIHFKDGDAWLEYNNNYGASTLYDSMLSHMGGMTRDIALVERYGPDPTRQFKTQVDHARIADNGLKTYRGMSIDNLWNQLTGSSDLITNAATVQRIARVGGGLRNIEVFGKLGGAVVSSVTDLGTYFITAGYNKIPYFDALSNIGKAAGGEASQWAAVHGVIADSMINDLHKWSGDNIRSGWTQRLASSTMKLSLMNAWTDTLRRGFSFSVMAKMSELSRKPWAQLDDYDKQLLTRRGVGEADWLVLNATKPEAFKGLEMLTPQAVRDAGGTGQLVSRIVGLVADEAEFAVLNPDLYTKALSSWGGTARGTPVGELSRSVMQFKSFPIAMMSRHWGRLMDAPSSSQGAPLAANKLAYGSAMFVSLTVLGAIAFQLKQMLQGKDPIALDDPKFWARAVAQGGGLSIAGDLLLTDPTDNPGDSTANMIKTLAGPVVGSVGELSAKTIENVYEYAKGKDTHAGAEYVNWLKSHTPYVGLWYTRAVFEHAVLNDINEAVSPGYLSKVEARGRKTFKQDYWWRPGEDTPSRGPDLSKLVD